MKLATISCDEFNVTVANGEKLHCNKKVESGQWSMEGRSFNTTLNVIPLGGYDIILGVSWMKSVSPITFDFYNQSISINWNKERLTLRQESSCPKITLIPEVNQGFSHSNEQVYLLVLVTEVEKERTGEELNSERVRNLIEEYQDIFKNPTELPPERRQDHHIPLKMGA